MLQSANGLHNFTLHAGDGEIGAIHDLYFDDERWIVRYLVASAGAWLSGRRVLISPASVKNVDWFAKTVTVSLTRDQVANGPDTAADQPVSRQHEAELAAFYGWPPYWAMSPLGIEPMVMPAPWQEALRQARANRNPGDPHLRSAREVKGYRIEARDGSIGHVSDLIFDEETWAIAFLVVEAGSWFHTRLVLLKPEWIEAISWEDRHVTVGVNRAVIGESPEFLPAFPLSAEYTEELLKHYRRTE